MRLCSFIIALWFVLGGTVAAQPEPISQWNLPNGLQEISGLAVASPTSVFAHNDEYGIVYEVSLTSGKVTRAFALGDPTIAEDFEGIASTDDRIYLITSDGRLFEADIGDHRGRVRYNVYDTGIGDLCEVEGLSVGLAPGEFLILCKQALKKKSRLKLQIYKWNINERRPPAQSWLDIAYKDFLKKSEYPDFRAAGLEWDAREGRVVVISSRSSSLYFFNEEGRLLDDLALPSSAHAQSEGVTISPAGEFIVADEGKKRGPGRLSKYRIQH